jgi:hypothetical protein
MILIPAPPALMSFTDALDGSDNASDIGANFVPVYDNMKLVTNRAQQSTPGSNTGRQGGWERFDNSSLPNGGRLLTDNWAIETTVASPVGSLAGDDVSAVGCAMPDTLSNGIILVYVAFLGGVADDATTAMSIYTYLVSGTAITGPGHATTLSGGTNQMTSRGTTSTARGRNNDVIRIERRMYSSTQSNVIVLRNGTQVCAWNDSSGIAPAGDRTKRRAFIQTEAHFPLFQNAFYSPAHASFRAYDLKV